MENFALIPTRWFHANISFQGSKDTAWDDVSIWDTALEVLEKYQKLRKLFCIVALLQPISSFADAGQCLLHMSSNGKKYAKVVVSVCKVDHSLLRCNILPKGGCMDRFLFLESEEPWQNLRQYYRINCPIYLIKTFVVQRWRRLVYSLECHTFMPWTRAVGIDMSFDFLIGEHFLRQDKCDRRKGLHTDANLLWKDNMFAANCIEHRCSVLRPVKGASYVKGALTC